MKYFALRTGDDSRVVGENAWLRLLKVLVNALSSMTSFAILIAFCNPKPVLGLRLSKAAECVNRVYERGFVWIVG